MNNIEQLRAIVSRLEQAHEAARVRLEQQMPDVDPYEVVDTNSRPILLDSLTSIVDAYTVLARA